jgi:four helix bundle protein
MMDKLRHRELAIWQRSMALAKSVYVVTKEFPAEERYALCDQLRRAVVSVPSNIAEGSARQTAHDFRHFLGIAKGSLAEVDTQLFLARDLGYVADIENLEGEILLLVKMINAFISTLPITD